MVASAINTSVYGKRKQKLDFNMKLFERGEYSKSSKQKQLRLLFLNYYIQLMLQMKVKSYVLNNASSLVLHYNN